MHGALAGGLTTKIYALVDANGNPIALKVTEGQAHDGKIAGDLLDTLGEGQILLGDCAYDSDPLRHRTAERGAWANVKPMPRRVNIPAFSRFLYRFRNHVERFQLRRYERYRGDVGDFKRPSLTTCIAFRIWVSECRIGREPQGFHPVCQ
jgi:transposase